MHRGGQDQSLRRGLELFSPPLSRRLKRDDVPPQKRINPSADPLFFSAAFFFFVRRLRCSLPAVHWSSSPKRVQQKGTMAIPIYPFTVREVRTIQQSWQVRGEPGHLGSEFEFQQTRSCVVEVKSLCATFRTPTPPHMPHTSLRTTLLPCPVVFILDRNVRTWNTRPPFEMPMKQFNAEQSRPGSRFFPVPSCPALLRSWLFAT